MNTVKIIPTGPFTCDIFVNDVNISSFVHGINISMTAGGATKVSLEIAAAKVIIPENLEALVNVKQDGGG